MSSVVDFSGIKPMLLEDIIHIVPLYRLRVDQSFEDLHWDVFDPFAVRGLGNVVFEDADNGTLLPVIQRLTLLCDPVEEIRQPMYFVDFEHHSCLYWPPNCPSYLHLPYGLANFFPRPGWSGSFPAVGLTFLFMGVMKRPSPFDLSWLP